MQGKKASGEDRMPYEFFKFASVEFPEELTEVCNHISASVEVLENLKNSIIFPIFTKGDLTDPANYRGISNYK